MRTHPSLTELLSRTNELTSTEADHAIVYEKLDGNNALSTRFCCEPKTALKKLIKKVVLPGFPDGTVVESLPDNAGDTGSSPGLGRSHMPWSN